jgi:hypothetical protein
VPFSLRVRGHRKKKKIPEVGMREEEIDSPGIAVIVGFGTRDGGDQNIQR